MEFPEALPSLRFQGQFGNEKMFLFVPPSFQRQSSKEGLTDEDLKTAIRKAEKGLVDADLGRRLVKQRIARTGQGAARGFRAVFFYRRGEVAVGLHIFPKSSKSNLSRSELEAYLKLARSLDELNDQQFAKLGAERRWKVLNLNDREEALPE
jgi:hypothetical protein